MPLRQPRFPISDHCDGSRFFVPGVPYPNRLIDILKWQFGGTRAGWPRSLPPRAFDHPPADVEGLRVTLVGHASLLIQMKGANFLIDPVWSARASPFSWAGPKRHNPPGIAFDDLPPIDAVLLTHNHYDHLDIPTLKHLATRFQPKFVLPLGNARLIASFVSPADRIALDWHDACMIGGTEIILAPAQHWSSRRGYDRNRMLWGGYVLKTPAGAVYITGDTGFNETMFRETGERYGPFELAVLPIGAYAPRWFMTFSHMNPAEAVATMRLLRAERAIGYHWGTFQLTDEAREEPREQLTAALEKKKIPPAVFQAFQPGDWQEIR